MSSSSADPEVGDTEPLMGRRGENSQEPTLRHKVYELFEEPDSSRAAFCVVFFIILCIIASTIAFCLETVPSMGEKYHEVFWAFEIFFVAVFTIEYIIRFWASVPEKMTAVQFMFSPLNVIDLLSIAPFFITLALKTFAKGSERYFDFDFRVLRAFRLVRIFKVGRYSSQLKLIAGAMQRSMASLVMLGLCMIFALIIFSTLIFLVERGVWDPKQGCYIRTGEHMGSFDGVCSPFQSIPEASWWAITTMTTVGYGDTFPITTGGRFVGGMTMVVGILCVALPTTVLGVQFSDSFAQVTEEKEIQDLKSKLPEKQEVRNELIKGMNHLDELHAMLNKLMPEIEQQLLKVTQNNTVRQNVIKASFGHLSDATGQSVENCKTFLRSTLPARF
eukprot:gnl/MRDRNA2_/MRDRNA2_34974_c0_seq1.p1 gnl/MRDRNA2_/MRDRNA2_34974_c0~~gnl/MRDRNA2_/MRDRNA2_34974_c0_seq1.p1  ORF type:complete len:389 (+),score=63.50 gnl/MRDRNA2_/MRDRNA2_34974_c0_seq1:140-1306(+)